MKNQLMASSANKKDIEYIEVVHSHIIKKDEKKGRKDEVIYTKQRVHLKDGTVFTEYMPRVNMKRDVYTTMAPYQTNKQKKSREFLKKLKKISTSESDIPLAIKRGLGDRRIETMYDVNRSRFVYGTGVESRVLLKHAHIERNKKLGKMPTPLDIVYFDVETDTDIHPMPVTIANIVWRDKKDKRIKSVSFVTDAYMEKVIRKHGRMYTVKEVLDIVRKTFKDNLPDNLPDDFDLEKIDYELTYVANEGDAIEGIFNRLHELSPDIVTGWNVNFDFTMSWDALKKYMTRDDGSIRTPESVFCDKRVPEKYQEIVYKEAPSSRTTQSGKVFRVENHKRWHTMAFPASFKILDQMASYYYVREGGKAMKGGYSLDNVSTAVLGVGKLKIKGVTESGLTWHKLMNEEYPIEYIAYNIWDDIILLLMNEKTRDMDITQPMLLGVSEWEDMGSGPSKTMNNLHFEYLIDKKVLGTNSSGESELTYKVDRTDWVVTVNSWMGETGVDSVLDDCDVTNTIGGYSSDNDCVASYPSDSILTGLSEETVAREVRWIEGLEGEVHKKFCKGQVAGDVNAGIMCREYHDMIGSNEAMDVIGEMLKVA